MNRSTCSRGDLVRVMARSTELLSEAATFLGYVQTSVATVDQSEKERKTPVQTAESSILDQKLPVNSAPTGDWPEAQTPIGMWFPYRFEPREERKHELIPTGEGLVWRGKTAQSPSWTPIAEWSSLVPRLRAELTEHARSSRIDVGHVVRRLAQGEWITQIPTESVRRWGVGLQVILDRSERLIPFYDDQDWFLEKLKRLVPPASIEVGIYNEAWDAIRLVQRQSRTREYRFPSAGTSIIVLSDLGALSQSKVSATWTKWAASLADGDHRALAVVPCSPRRVSPHLRSLLQVIPWQKLAVAQSCADPVLRQSLVDRLFQYLAPAKRIEPGLLRAVRRLIAEATDVSLESDFWQDSRLASSHSTAATPQTDRSPDFQNLDIEDRRRALSVIREWRQTLPAEIWISEIWALDAESEQTLSKQDRDDAQRWQQLLESELEVETRVALRAWLSRTTKAIPQRAMARHRHLRAIYRRLHGTENLLGGDPQELPRGERRVVALGQIGNSIACFPSGSPQCRKPNWHQLGLIETRASMLAVLQAEQVKQASFWRSGSPPSWASDWGRDECGAWAEFIINSSAEDSVPSTSIIKQRMRWIRPGTFQMGSPETEEGRYLDEGPQHEVTLTRGFWMFDTPVTQELWRAVMGDNPSKFKGDRLPAETVSWDDAQRFLKNFNARFSEAIFALPTEAQWEYACRAGSQTAYFFGNDPKRLGDFAWYGLNSSTSTHPVATKPCNRNGLFDMHGNVWEWCQDFWSENYKAAANVDPTGPEKGIYRVLRGGSWNSTARLARSASRNHYEPGSRNYYVGFRCAQVLAAAEPTEEDGEAAEPQACPTKGGAAFELPVSSVEIFSPKPIPAGPILIVRSDMETLELHKFAKPEWASAIGRDRFGLWAEFTINAEVSVQQQPKSGTSSSKRKKAKVEPTPVPTQLSVVQRMRWIPPGRFWMGSSESDELASADEKPQHEVILSHGYWLFDTPVTQELWLAVMKENPSHFSNQQNRRRPVESVSWDDCLLFIKTINESKVGIDGLKLTLPTEAEWEYACRAGTTTRYSFGDEISPQLANYWTEATKTHETSEVEKFPSNPWGLFDMHGNVYEWCFDWYDEKYYAASALKDPVGPKGGHSRVLRGGSWNLPAQTARSAYRNGYEPGNRSYNVGFRCAQVHSSTGAAREQTAGANERRDEQGADATPPDRSE